MNLRPLVNQFHCSYCNQLVLTSGYRDWEGNCACNEHKDMRCFSCDRFIGVGAVMREPSVWLCPSCMQHLITPELAEKSIAYIRQFYGQLPIGKIPYFDLHVLSEAEMAKRAGKGAKGYTFYPPSHGVYEIFTLRNLSMTVFTMVVAHEMLHLWQFERNVHPASPLSEGFCNLGAYLIMQSIGKPVSEGQLVILNNDPSPVYGDGFRQIKAIYERHGWQGVIQEISK